MRPVHVIRVILWEVLFMQATLQPLQIQSFSRWLHEVPLMALSATLPRDEVDAICKIVKDPVKEIASVNKPNISYHVRLGVEAASER